MHTHTHTHTHTTHTHLQGLLAPEGRRVISTLVLTVFTPALFFSKLGSGVGLREAMQLWCAHLGARVAVSAYVCVMHGSHSTPYACLQAPAICPSALFGKPRPLAESPQTALPNHHCLMLQ